MPVVEAPLGSHFHQPVAVVWFKRDLRLQDHAPLAYAIEHDLPVIPLFVFEPSLVKHQDTSDRHLRFQYESLLAMEEKLSRYNGTLYIFHDEVINVLKELTELFPRMTLLSHLETGTKLTYDRDIKLLAYCKDKGIPWEEFPNHGVIRALKARKEWDQHWLAHMEAPQERVDLEKMKVVLLDDEWLETHQGAPLPAGAMRRQTRFQRGGTHHAKDLLHSFFEERIHTYQTNMSNPLTSRDSCSRLSPYIAWGNVSIRQIYQAHQSFYQDSPFPQQMEAFVSRLWWHCHFIQKLESEPRLEFDNLNSAYDKIRTDTNPRHVKAWKQGLTGYPLIDASMRCVIHTGYLNFRMRAMLVSFLTHHLWQDWRNGVHHLAKQFLDYEPGIHYAQFQMQASTTGINTIRIYNPTKQAYEQDPQGVFIKQWLPELEEVPLSLLHEPWNMTPMEQSFYNCHIGRDYPKPIVDAKESAKAAKEALWAIKQSPEAKEESKRILATHANTNRRQQEKEHKSPKPKIPPKPKATPTPTPPDTQIPLLEEWTD